MHRRVVVTQTHWTHMCHQHLCSSVLAPRPSLIQYMHRWQDPTLTCLHLVLLVLMDKATEEVFRSIRPLTHFTVVTGGSRHVRCDSRSPHGPSRALTRPSRAVTDASRNLTGLTVHDDAAGQHDPRQ